ncbi:MAG: patatin-like phospholipase family protein [Pseudomonadaceae bacterium]|nr:patatin-like phospholipase family protein [Pseudomonadaceae bacterium]
MRRALVLGGGGIVGNAWEVGVVSGLLDAGVDLRDADTFVGTSAGSVVGSRLAAGQDLREPVRRDPDVVRTPLAEAGPDPKLLRKIFSRWADADVVDEAFCKEIGALALSAHTADESAWIAAAAANASVDAWPEADLRLIAVDVDTGQRVVLCPGTDVTLHQALAASCSVPGMFPVIHAAGKRLMDGGVHSGTSADVLLVDEPGLAVVIAPIVTGTAAFGDLASRCIDTEVATLKAAGWQVLRVLPSPPEKEIFGPNLMDPDRAEGSLEAGRARGSVVAGLLGRLWRAE